MKDNIKQFVILAHIIFIGTSFFPLPTHRCACMEFLPNLFWHKVLRNRDLQNVGTAENGPVSGGTGGSNASAAGNNLAEANSTASLPAGLNTGTKSPTSVPTESPAPSPSPSERPTAMPTVTNKPTKTPTSPPTESPAPSPSPSEVPTKSPTNHPTATPSFQPTTTPYPTDQPSQSPTMAPTVGPSAHPSESPTVSPQPSQRPSAPPTPSPSSSPSVSSQPSVSPTSSPSISGAPSASPTHIREFAANWTFTLELTSLLHDTEVEALEGGTEQWMEQLKMDNGGFLSDAEVTVESQSLIIPTPFDRKLEDQNDEDKEDEEPREPYMLLEVAMRSSSIYTGPDVEFDLAQLEGPLQRNDPEWIHLLGNMDNVFLSLRPSPEVAAIAGNPSAPKNEPAIKSGMSTGLYTFVVFAAVLAVILGVIASVYSVRNHSQGLRGTELVSPLSAGGKPNLTTWPTEDSGAVQVPSDRNNKNDRAIPLGMDDMNNSALSGVSKWPHENKKAVFQKVAYPQAKAVFRQQEGQSDPPSAEINFGRMSALFDQTEDNSNMSSAYADSRISVKPPPKNASYLYPQQRVGPSKTVDSQEIMLTKSTGGTLGATAVDGSNAGTGISDYAGQAKSFLQTVLGAKPTTEQPPRPAAANKTAPSAIDRTVSYDSVLRRPGLYDVFAPAGPIGIVVDTTKDGPAVHSLKSNSPMLGLINPGDLIVGLDDEDTRGMTAATLTRLMARKSSQKERKITLLTSEAYY